MLALTSSAYHTVAEQGVIALGPGGRTVVLSQEIRGLLQNNPPTHLASERGTVHSRRTLLREARLSLSKKVSHAAHHTSSQSPRRASRSLSPSLCHSLPQTREEKGCERSLGDKSPTRRCAKALPDSDSACLVVLASAAVVAYVCVLCPPPSPPPANTPTRTPPPRRPPLLALHCSSGQKATRTRKDAVARRGRDKDRPEGAAYVCTSPCSERTHQRLLRSSFSNQLLQCTLGSADLTMPWITVEPPPAPVRESPVTAVVSQLGLGAIVLLVVAMTYRRLREEPPSRETPSKRSFELTRGGTPAHILEHIARISDPEYICLAIAENKLTVRSKLVTYRGRGRERAERERDLVLLIKVRGRSKTLC